MPEPAFTWTAQYRPRCQLGLGEPRSAEPSSWLDISCYVHEAEVFRGHDRFTERFAPGTASATLKNTTGWADLVGVGAAVAAKPLRPGRPIRFGIEGPWGTGGAVEIRWLFRGWIDQAKPTYDPVLEDIVSITCIDALGEAGSSTAPTGPFVGAGETVDVRLHRVLDAVGWFPTKRTIATSTVQVQGTTLGERGIDAMGAAADSAGGVVYGEVDGNVVYRGINWALYDPDTPPDDNIGNVDPGTPGLPYTPPYIDPTKGYVYWPEPPPFDAPSTIIVCAEAGEGTLVQQGNEVELFVKDGKLYYASSGQLFDMGYYNGGCVAIGVDPTNPDGPTRTDDPDEDGHFDFVHPPAPPVAPVFAVDLLSWSQGCPEDGTQSYIEVGPFAPGKDSMLFVLIAAQNTPGSTGGMKPTVDFDGLLSDTGDAFDWRFGQGNMEVDNPQIAIGYFFGVLKRDGVDPGSTSIAIDWPGDNESRLHIVAVFRVTHPPAGFGERVFADDVYAGFQMSVAVGAGNRTLPVTGWDNWEPVRLDPTDVTVAISLADRPDVHDPPWGATFASGWVDPLASSGGATAALFSDNFNRTDGGLGTNWISPLMHAPTYFGDPHAAAISGNGVITPNADTPETGTPVYTNAAAQAVYTLDENTGSWVEVVVTGTCQGTPTDAPNETIELFVQANDTTARCHHALVTFVGNGSTGFDYTWIVEYITDTGVVLTHDNGSVHANFAAGSTVTVRLESSGGQQRIFVNGTQMATTGLTHIAGTRCGFGVRYVPTTGGGGTSAKVDSFAMGKVVGVNKCASWSIGTRTGTKAPDAAWADIDISDVDTVASDLALVIETDHVPGFIWHTDGSPEHLANSDGSAITGPTQLTDILFPHAETVLVAFVGITADTDVASAITVTNPHVTFTRQLLIAKTTGSRGQGAIFTAPIPATYAGAFFGTTTVAWGSATIHTAVSSFVEVRYADPLDPIGTSVGARLGTGTAGSVDGPFTMNLPATPSADSVILAFMTARCPGTGTAGASVVDGGDWVDEVWDRPAGVYSDTISRSPETGSTSTAVIWDDLNVGTGATDGVALAIEIIPQAGFLFAAPDGTDLVVGGFSDPYTAPIYSVTRKDGLDPNAGTIVWTTP